MTSLARWSAIVSVCPGLLLLGAEVSEKSGDIFAKINAGTVKQLTSRGVDYDPSLSCDSKSVVFVRRTPTQPRSSSQLGTKDGTEIWIIKVDDANSEKRVFAASKEETSWVGLFEPHFSADSRNIYFLKWFGNGLSLYKLSLDTGELKRLTDNPVTKIWQVCGINAVVAAEDHLKLVGGHVDLYWLYEENGRRNLVGTSETDVEAFLRR